MVVYALTYLAHTRVIAPIQVTQVCGHWPCLVAACIDMAASIAVVLLDIV